MKLIEKVSQHRRDFMGKYQCQGCGTVTTDGGHYSYDDDYFHDEVIPRMRCAICGKSTIELDLPNERMGTTYSANQIV